MMYRIIKTDGTELGITDSVKYIRIGASGCFTPADKKNAIGIAFQSTPYNLVGHENIEGADTVIVSAIDGGNYIMQKNIESEQMITELDIANIEAQQAITELELMILGG